MKTRHCPKTAGTSALMLMVPLAAFMHLSLAQADASTSLTATRTSQASNRPKEILSDARLLQLAGIKAVAEDKVTGIAYARINPQEEAKLSQEAHKWGRCGGFEAIDTRRENLRASVAGLREHHKKNMMFNMTKFRFTAEVPKKREIEAAVAQVSEDNLRELVKWLSSFPTRYNKGPTPNTHVTVLKERLEKMAQAASYPIKVDLIDHQSTPQKTIRVHIEGRQRPNETVVLGAHLDSVNMGWFADAKEAPGADDNASGSSNLIEALRILVRQPQPERSIEFFWYAGEESGLLGSSEIARAYKERNRDIIGVLQLDMTLYPGSGEFVLGSMTDFTSAWLRQHLTTLNQHYINAKIIDDRCGYGCSDHASWHRQGYPTLMPFEATFRASNKLIHTKNDRINADSNFKHSAMFSKIAVAFAMDLSNSTLRQP